MSAGRPRCDSLAVLSCSSQLVWRLRGSQCGRRTCSRGRPTPVEPEAFKLVAALDLSLMVPALGVGGVLIWRRMPWGLVISAIASIQGALYLFVLSVNSVVAIHRGLTAPGELPIWGTLTIFTGSVATVLLASVRSERAEFLTR